MIDPKKVYVGISILGRGSNGVFDLDDEQSKRKVNGSNRSNKTPGENSKGNYLNKLQYTTHEDSDVRKFQVFYLAKDYFFSNYLFCVILQGEHVLLAYVQNVIPAFLLFVHE